MKAWLCMTPVRLRVGGVESACPPEALALLGVFRTKKLGREVCGKSATFVEIELNS
jgi:hypothetical protein